MGRQEGRIETEHEPIGELARELRRLRARAGSPTYRSMAARTHYAASTLSRAAAGKVLPSLDVVMAYAQACGASRAEWKQRWQRASAALEPQPDKTDPQVPPIDSGQRAPRPPSGQYWLRLLAAAAVVLALLSAVIGLTMSHSIRRQPQGDRLKRASGSAASRISDGDDPRADGCASPADAQAAALGAREIAVRTIRSHSGMKIGWLALWRNQRCGAAWAEASYVNPHLYPVTLETHRPDDGATVVDHAVVNLPYNPIIGKLLTTAQGCSWARMILVIPGSAPIVTQTPCS